MCQFESRLDPGYLLLSNAIQAILAVPGNLDVSISNTPVALPPSRMELSTVFAVQDLLSSKTLHKPSDQDDNATLIPPSIMYQFAPSVKLRRLKRLLAFPQSYITDDLSMRSRDTLSKTEWVVNSHGFREWLDSDSLLIIRGPRGSGKSTLAYRIAHFLGVEKEEDLEDTPRRCVLSYFYGNTLGSDDVIVQMLNQFLLQFLEIMPVLARHFPNHRVFGRARPSWPEWDEQNWTAYDEDSKKMCPDLDTLSRETESTRGLSSKDLLISPFTVRELVEILISIIHDELVGEVIMIIDGLDNSSEISKSLFRRFLELIETMRSKQVKVCLSCDTAQIHSLKHIVALDTLHNFEPVLQPVENLDILFRSVHEKYRVIPSRKNELMLLAGKIRSICMRSHLAVSLARQILGGLSSLDDLKAFTATLEECRMGDLEPEKEIDKLYHWAFDHLIILRGWRHMSLLFLIAVAERPLNLAEANALVPSPSEFASWCDEDYKTDTTLSEERNASKPFPETDTMQGVHALESKLLGLVRISNGTLTLFHPDLKTFLLQKLSDRHLRFHLHYHIGIACLTLLQDLIQGSSQMTYDLESQRYTLPVENFSYPLRYWSKHLSVAQSSDQWIQYESMQVLFPLARLWDNAEVRDLIHGFSPARLPPVSALSIPCILAAHDLAKVLEHFYFLAPGQLPRRDMNLSLEQRCAVVNSGSKAQAVFQRHGQESASSDQYGRTIENYKAWAKSRHDAEQLLLPDWIREAIGIDKMGKCDWGTVRGIAKNASEHKKLSKDSFQQLIALAVRRNDVELVADLLDDGARCHYIDKDDPRKPSVYHIAASIGNTDLVQELIHHASLFCATDAFGMRPIHWAVERGHHEMVKLLVTATLNQDERGQIPLFMACEGVSPTTVLAVLEQGFPPSFTDKLNRTPMHVASSIGATDVVQLLLSKGGNPEAQDDQGITPLHLAAFGGWTGVVDELLASGVFIDVTTNDQQTPLRFACESPNPSLEVVFTLLRRQANPYAKDSEGITPLHIAVRNGSVATVQLLLKSVTHLNGVEELLELAEQNQEITRIIHTMINQGKFVPALQSKINVVFVHGYYESPTKTWSEGSASWLWPTKYLLGSELQARVYFWDRQLELTDFLGAANVSELGTKLLDFVRSIVYAPELSSKSGKTMPLVFVSHSLGGLVVKAALAGAARKNDSCLRAIKGLVFLGTPHQELDENSRNDAVQRLVQAAIDNRLDPGRNNSLSGQTKLGFAHPEQTEAYNKLDFDFGGICQSPHPGRRHHRHRFSWIAFVVGNFVTVEVASDTRFILILDALDECGPETEHDSNYLDRVCRFISRRRPLRNLKICFSSRPSSVLFSEFSEVAQLRMEDLNSSDIVRDVEQPLLLTGGFGEVTPQQMDHFSSSDIVKYVEQRLANGEVNPGLAEDVTYLSWGAILQRALTVHNLIQRLKDDLDFNHQIVRTPELLETLYERMLDDIPSHYKKETSRILRIIAIVPFQLDIDLLSIAVEDYSVEPGSSIQGARSDLAAVNATYGYHEPKRSESAHEERRLKATRRMNRRCGGLLSIQDGNDIRFIHDSVRSFLSKPQNSQRLLGELTDTRFDPPMNLLSACIIRLKQNLDEEWPSNDSTVDYRALINKLVTQALAAASLADIEHGTRRFYIRLFGELSDPLPTSLTYTAPVPGSFNGIIYEHYRVLLAIKAELWWYLLTTVNENIVMLKDNSNVSLLTHLINTKDLATLPWATTIRDSHNLPRPDVVKLFFKFQADPNDATPDRNVWREVLEAGYHVFAVDIVPSNPGPAQTSENRDKWVKIMGLFLEYGADVNAGFPEARFELRDPPPAVKQSTSLRFKTLEPKQALLEVLGLNGEYDSEYRRYLRIVEEKRDIQLHQVAEAPTSPQLMPVSATPGPPNKTPWLDHLSPSSSRSCAQPETGGVSTIDTEEGQPPGDHAQRRTSRSAQQQPSEESQPEQEVQRDRWSRLRQGIIRFRHSRAPK
ncbi:Ankyrin-3 [Metarhizium anisopliae]